MRIVAIAAAVAIGMAASSVAAVAADSDWVARVKRVAGEAYVERDGVQAPLLVGDRLPASAVIVTGPKSGAGLTFRDNTRVSVGANARLGLADYAFVPGQPAGAAMLKADLQNGAAAFVSGRITERQPGAMQVSTPAAVMGVRGTTFLAVTSTPLDRQ
jgi:hypothetical protein